MNPLEYVDTLEGIQLKKIIEDSKEQYTKDEVIDLLKDVSLEYRKAIYNGEYILDVETLNKRNVKINDTEFSVQKLVTHDDKYLLFLQVTNVLNEVFGEVYIQEMAEEINKAIKKANNIAGVIILPPEMEISLITAKLETLSYAEKLRINEEDLKELNFKISQKPISQTKYYTSETTSTGQFKTYTSTNNNFYFYDYTL